MLQSVRSRLPALLVYVADTATLKVVARVGREGAHPLGHVKWLNLPLSLVVGGVNKGLFSVHACVHGCVHSEPEYMC